MSDTTSPLAVLRDPLMVAKTHRLLSERGRRTLRLVTVLNAVVGAIDGLALLVVLPLSTALSTNAPQRGLGTTEWLWILFGIAALGAVLRYVTARINYDVALDLIRNGHRALGDALAGLPLGWFHSSRTGGLSQLVSDGFMRIAETMAHLVGQVVIHTSTLLVVVIGSWFWDPALGLTLTVIAPVAAVVMVVAQSIRRSASEKTVAPGMELSNRIVEFSTCQPALRAAGRSEQFGPLIEAGRVEDRARIRELWVSLIPMLLNGLVMQAALVAVITFAANMAIDGGLDPLQTIALIGLTLRYAHILNELGEQFVGLDLTRTPLNQVADILDEPRVSEPETVAELPDPGRLELDGVTFGYDPDRPVLRDISLIAEPGTLVAVVGPSGSGKTTIARLVARFWDVDSGAVRVGGTDVREQTTDQIMAQLSMVFQDVYLFDDTLIENIRVGRDGATDEEVYAAADLAGVTSIAQRLPDGWNARVGEGGRSLSGGERQRVSVARALLKQAPIVLLDEATSALDAENEANIVASVAALRAHATVLVIAHKLDTVRAADRIVVLGEDGRVAETGTHDDLFAAGGAYRNFWERRRAATGWILAG